MAQRIERGEFAGIKLKSRGAEDACKVIAVLILLDIVFMGAVGLYAIL